MDNNEFNELKRKIIGSGTKGRKFDFNDPDTHHLLKEMENWPKGDVHTHISASISPDHFVRRYAAFESNHGRRAFERIRGKAQDLAGQIDEDLAKDMIKNIRQLFTYDPNTPAKECYDERGKLPDGILKHSLGEFRLAVADVSRQHFRDNVQDLQLRFFPGGLHYGPNVEHVVNAAYEGFRDAENDFPGCKGSMIFTFNRNKKEMLTKIRGYLTELYRIKRTNPDLGERMIGIDLCGFTDIAEKTKELEGDTLKYADALSDVKQNGFFITCHMGEYYGFNHANLELSIDMLRQGIENIGFDRIGHGIVLDPIRADKVDPTGSLKKKADAVLEIVKERDIVIESCPYVYVSSDEIDKYRVFPTHGWIKEGINVRLGTDGLWTYRTSLSREAVKLLLSNPYDITLNDMKRVVGSRGYNP